MEESPEAGDIEDAHAMCASLNRLYAKFCEPSCKHNGKPDFSAVPSGASICDAEVDVGDKGACRFDAVAHVLVAGTCSLGTASYTLGAAIREKDVVAREQTLPSVYRMWMGLAKVHLVVLGAESLAMGW